MRIPVLILTFLVICVLSPKDGSAQISFDNNAVATNSAGTGNAVTVSVPMGNDRLLVAVIGTDDQTNTPTVTFDGMNMTLAADDKDDFNSTYDARVLVYYLALGSGNQIEKAVTVSGLDNYYTVGAMSFQGVAQTTIVKQTATAPIPTGTVNTSQVATTLSGVTAGNLLLAFFGEDNVKQFGWGGTYIAEGTHTNSGLNGDGYYYASYNVDAAASDHTFTYDINNGIQSCAGVLIEFAKKPTVVLPSVSVALSPSSVVEDGTSTLDYTFTVSAAPTSDLTVNFEISGTAEDDDDFTVDTPMSNNETVSYTIKAGVGNNTGTITIKSGQTRGVLRITPTADSDVEANETIIVTITN